MITANRKGFKFNMSISDNVIFGIGLVTYQWSLLENTLNLWTSIATGSAHVRSAGQRSSFKERVDFLSRAIQAEAIEPGRSTLLSLLSRAKEMQAERDKVVHWLWSEDPKGQPGVSEWNLNKTWTVNYQKLRAIALKIDDINASLIQAGIEYGGVGSRTDGLLSVAWRRICGRPDPTE